MSRGPSFGPCDKIFLMKMGSSHEQSWSKSPFFHVFCTFWDRVLTAITTVENICNKTKDCGKRLAITRVVSINKVFRLTAKVYR